MPQLSQEKPLLKIDMQLGEGPLYDEATGILHFVDVGNNCIYHYDTASSKLETDYYDECIASLAFRNDGDGLIAIARQGLASVPFKAPPSSPSAPHKLTYICENPIPKELQDHRMYNDSAVDARGRIFAGSKTLRGQPFNEDQLPGRFYMFELREGKWHSEEVEAIGHMTVPNGVGFSPDYETMYVSDTRTLTVYSLDYELETGRVSNRRPFITTPWEGRPDGLTIDSRGCIWVAKYAGAKVTCYSPAGEEIAEVALPTSLNVTSVYFGSSRSGSDSSTLYITTGSLRESGEDGDETKVRRYPDCGSLFAIDVQGVQGRPKPPVRVR